MAKIEYKVVTFDFDVFDTVEEQLNTLGIDGWELVQVLYENNRLVLKRLATGPVLEIAK